MDLYDALADAEAASADVARQQADLVAQAEAKQAELEDLHLEIKGLKKAIARHERRLNHASGEEAYPITDGRYPPAVSAEHTPASTPTPETVKPQASAPSADPQSSVTDGHVSGDWRDLHRTEAVAKMLAEVSEPVSPSNLSRMLQRLVATIRRLQWARPSITCNARSGRTRSSGRSGCSPTKRPPPTTDVAQGEEVSSDQEVNGAAPTLGPVP